MNLDDIADINLDNMAKITAIAAIGTAVVLTNFSKEIIQSIEPYILARQQEVYQLPLGERK